MKRNLQVEDISRIMNIKEEVGEYGQSSGKKKPKSAQGIKYININRDIPADHDDIYMKILNESNLNKKKKN